MLVELDSFSLLRIRRIALRRGIWFKVLDSAERAMLNLVPKCMCKPRSPKLIDMLAKIIVKVNEALRSKIDRVIRQVGRPLARRLSRIALKWGHKTAGEWARDEGFSRYLAVENMNTSYVWQPFLS